MAWQLPWLAGPTESEGENSPAGTQGYNGPIGVTGTVRDTGPVRTKGSNGLFWLLVLMGYRNQLDPLKLLGHIVLLDQLILLERPDKLKMMEICGCRNLLKILGIWLQQESQGQGVYPTTNAYLGTFLSIRILNILLSPTVKLWGIVRSLLFLIFQSLHFYVKWSGIHILMMYCNITLGLDSRNPHRLVP